MEPRINYLKVAHGVFEAMIGLSNYLQKCGLEESLIDLICLRASQINGCAYCIDMHWKDLRAAGEEEQRLYGLDAWEESPYYSDRERAALAWTDSVTNVREGHVPDEVYEQVRKFFTGKRIGGPNSRDHSDQWLESPEHCGKDYTWHLSACQVPRTQARCVNKEKIIITAKY